MKNNQPSLFSFLFLAVLLSGIFYFMMPQSYDVTEAPLSKFSTKRALEIVKNMSAKPHFVGSQNHKAVANYLQKELQSLGLQTTVQEGFTMTDNLLKWCAENKMYLILDLHAAPGGQGNDAAK